MRRSIITQTSLSLDVLEGINNATILVGGEVLGIVSGGLGKINDETLEIELQWAGGDLYINGQLITDKKWTYKNWFHATGWPTSWEIWYRSGESAKYISLYIVFADGKQSYYFTPTKVIKTNYSHYIQYYNESQIRYQNANSYRSCLNGKIVSNILFTYKFTGTYEGINFMTAYLLGINFFSDNFPHDYVLCCYGEDPCRGFKVPEYAWDECYSSSSGVLPHQDGDHEIHIHNSSGSSRKLISKSYQEWHGETSFYGWGLICPEDKNLRPTACITDPGFLYCYVVGCDRGYEAISPVEYRVYYKIKGSSLESQFLEKGYPLIEREVDITITGVDNRVL